MLKLKTSVLMKRFIGLFLLFSVLFTACDDNDNGVTSPTPIPLKDWKGNFNDPSANVYKKEYNGHYNPLAGMWKLTKKNGSSVGDKGDIYTFNKDLLQYKVESYNLSSLVKPFTDYMINNSQFREENSVIKYRFTDDAATLIYGDGTYTNTYEWISADTLSNKENWNIEGSSHYVEGYNPVKGTWKLITENNQAIKRTLYYHFTDERMWHETSVPEDNTTNKASYYLNDEAIRIIIKLSETLSRTFTYDYRIEEENGKSILRMRCTYPYLDDVMVFEQIN